LGAQLGREGGGLKMAADSSLTLPGPHYVSTLAWNVVEGRDVGFNRMDTAAKNWPQAKWSAVARDNALHAQWWADRMLWEAAILARSCGRRLGDRRQPSGGISLRGSRLLDEERRRARTAPPTSRDEHLSAAFALAAAHIDAAREAKTRDRAALLLAQKTSRSPAAVVEESLRIARAIEVRWGMNRHGREALIGGKDKQRLRSYADLTFAEEVALTETRIRLLPLRPVDIADAVISTFFQIVCASHNGLRNWQIMLRRLKGEPIASIARSLHVGEVVVKQTPRRQYERIGRQLESLMPSSPKFAPTAILGDASENISDLQFESETSRKPSRNSNCENAASNIGVLSKQFGILSWRASVIQNDPETAVCYTEIRGRGPKTSTVNYCPQAGGP
jgi:hypothetical protein